MLPDCGHGILQTQGMSSKTNISNVESILGFSLGGLLCFLLDDSLVSLFGYLGI